MTQATQSAPPGPATARTSPLPAPTEHPIVLAGRDMPRQLSRLRLVSVLLVLAFAALTAFQLLLAAQSLQAAAKDTAQLVRVQNIKVHMLRADALATNAFLIGGLESPEQREQYDLSLAAVTRGIAEAAEAQPLDRDVLIELNQVVVDYAEGMAQARATNRQGLPVGAGYLRASSQNLRDHGVLLVDALVEANTDRASRSLGAQIPLLIALPAVVTLVLLGLMNQWIARRFHRRINTGLVGAAAVVLVLGIAAFAVSTSQAGVNSELRSGAYATAVKGSEARSDANAAKTNESLRLVARGSGQSFEEEWQRFSGEVTAALQESALSNAPSDDWDRYLEGHSSVVSLDQGGDWDRAVELATGRGDGTPTAAFASFDAGMESMITSAAEDTTAALRAGTPAFYIVAVVTILGGLAAAGLAWRGVTARLKEYL